MSLDLIVFYNGYQYFVFFINDFSRYFWICPIKHKSKVVGTFHSFHVIMERQLGHKLKYFQSSFGGEFQALSSYFLSHGIIHRRSCPHAHEQMVLSKGKSSTLLKAKLLDDEGHFLLFL